MPGRSTSALLPGAVRPSRVAQCHGSAGSKFRRIPGIGGARDSAAARRAVFLPAGCDSRARDDPLISRTAPEDFRFAPRRRLAPFFPSWPSRPQRARTCSVSRGVGHQLRCGVTRRVSVSRRPWVAQPIDGEVAECVLPRRAHSTRAPHSWSDSSGGNPAIRQSGARSRYHSGRQLPLAATH